MCPECPRFFEKSDGARIARNGQGAENARFAQKQRDKKPVARSPDVWANGGGARSENSGGEHSPPLLLSPAPRPEPGRAGGWTHFGNTPCQAPAPGATRPAIFPIVCG